MGLVNYLINKLAGYDILKSEKELRLSLNKAEREIETHKREIEAQKININDLTKENSELKETTERNSEELISKTKELDKAKKELVSREDEYERISNYLCSRQEEINRLEKVVDELKTKNKSNQGTIMNHVKKINALTEDVERISAEKATIESKIQEKDEIIDKREREIEQLNKQKEDEGKHIAELSNELNLVKNEKESLSSQLEAMKSEKTDMERIQNELKSKIATLEQELEGASKVKPEEIRELEAQIQKNEETIQSKKREIEVLEFKRKEDESRFKDVCDQLSDLRSEKSGLLEQIHDYELQNQKLREENSSMADKITELEKQLLETTKAPDATPPTKPEVPPIAPAVGEPIVHVGEPPIIEEGQGQLKVEDSPKPTQVKPQGVETGSQGDNPPGVKRVTKKSKVSEAVDLSDGSIKDMPLITNDSNKQTQRTIEYVYDENSKIVYADDFFNRSAEEIAQVARKMSEAEISGKRYWTCGLCHHRVKIAHRTFNGKESLFFVHANRDHYCPWIKKSTSSKDNIDEEVLLASDDILVEDTIDERKTKSRELKEKIFALLTSPESEEMGISDVQMDEIIRSNVPYMKWRRPDIYFLHNGRKVVIELQKKSHDLNSIVDRDVFFRLNDIQILWVFGSESDTSYDYMRKMNYKNTMFDNHRNVFVFDKEAQTKSEEKGILYLKCNWLNDDDSWHFRIENSGANGKLVSIKDLIYDEEYCKPYHYDANEEYFAKYPEAREAYMATKMSREELKKAIEEKWTRDKNYEEAMDAMHQRQSKATPYCVSGLWGFRFNTTVIIPPIFTVQPKDLYNGFYLVNQGGCLGIVNYYGEKIVNWDGIFECDDMNYDATNKRVFFVRNGCWGVADIEGNELIPASYQAIQTWSSSIYRVKKDDKWGLCDTGNDLLAKCIYDTIDLLYGFHAKAIKVHPTKPWTTVAGYLDERGNEVYTIISNINEGYLIILSFSLCGIMTANKEYVVPCIYEDIKPWSNNLYRVKENDKWGILNIEDHSFLLPIKYDSISELDKGVAKVVFANVESSIDINGNEVAQDVIELKDGLKKTKIAGKWGIVDANGEIIVNHQYDEIGSFRSRLIGFINKGVIKLNGSYHYPIPMSGKFMTTDVKHRLVFDIGGVRCIMHDSMLKQANVLYSDICVKEKVCPHLSFMDIIVSKKSYWMRVLDLTKPIKLLSQGDKEEDYRNEEVLTGKVTKYINKKGVRQKIILEFDDGRITRVPRRFFSPKEDIDSLHIGDSVTLQKIGYDEELDQTIWNIIKE